jgi:hypothetical protein
MRIIRNVLNVAVLAGLLATTASAAMISYAPHDLGANRWQLDYVVADHGLQVGQGFDVYFPYGQYEDLALVSAADGWDALVFQPDLVLGVPEPGMLDGLQVADMGGAPAEFSLQLTWFGPGAPEPQAFELYDADFNVLESGLTVLVPEPGAALLLAGLAGLVIWRRR